MADRGQFFLGKFMGCYSTQGTNDQIMPKRGRGPQNHFPVI